MGHRDIWVIFLLRHFVHLSYGYIKTQHNSVHSPTFSDILTAMT